jgi:ABC-type branched-subunit amino acid transport system substrate-binding protein
MVARLRDGVLLYQQMHPEVAKDVQFIFEDDMSSPAGSAKAALKLIEVDKVQAIVTYFGYGTEAIAPIAKRKGVMVMALTFDLEHIAAPDSYAIWPSMKSHNEIMAATLKELATKMSALWWRVRRVPCARWMICRLNLNGLG